MSFTTVFIAKFNFLAMNKTPLLAVMLSAILFGGSLSYNQAFAGFEACGSFGVDVGSLPNSFPAGPDGDTEIPAACFFVTESWQVGPQEISFEQNAGPWIKFLDLGQIFPQPFQQNQNVGPLTEIITVGDGPEWTDWHEEIQQHPIPGAVPTHLFEFTSIIIEDNISGDPIPFTLRNTLPDTAVWVDFDPPLQPGTELFIEKQVQYVGDFDFFPSQNPEPFITVKEFPTHEERQISGELLPIDSTALVIAGISSEYSALSILALLGAISVGTLYFVTRRTF